MASVEQHLRRWLSAGVIDSSTAAAIREFERQSEPATTARPTIVEAIVYLAIAAIGAGFLVLVIVNWEDMAAPVHVALPAVATIALLVSGMAMRKRDHPGLRRGADVAWMATVATAAATGAVSASEAGADAEWVACTAAVVALAFAIVLWLNAQTDLQVLAIAGSAGLASLALASVASDHGNEDYPPLVFGVTLILFSALGVVAVEAGIFRPFISARALSAAGLVFGSLYCAVSPEPSGTEVVAFVVAGAAAYMSMQRGVFVYMAVAVLCTFIGLSAVILRHVDDPTVAAIAFIACGIALLAATIILERWRPWQRGNTGGQAQGQI